MSDFNKLKSSRLHKEAKRSFVKRDTAAGNEGREAQSPDEPMLVDPSNVVENEGKETQSQDERMLVDSSDTRVIPSDIPEQSSKPSEQLSDTDELFASLPENLEVRSSGSQIRGRGIWMKTPRRMGEILLSEAPAVATLSTRYLTNHCSTCFLEAGDKGLKRCPSCRLIYYCDSDCQTRDWPTHKRECDALQKWAASAPSTGSLEDGTGGIIIASDAIRCLGRLLWKRQKNGRESVWLKRMDSMQSHRQSLSTNEESSQLHTHMAHALVRYLGLESASDLAEYSIDSIAALVDLVSRFTTNAFSVTSPTLTPIGVCISTNVALFNHSCEPNAVLVFPRSSYVPKKEQPLLQVIALRNIMPNEEVMISYIDSTLPRHQRQKALKETYYFTCDCSLCSKQRESAPSFVDPREGMYCLKKCGGVCWLPTEESSFTRCTKCKAVVADTDAVLDAIRIGEEALEKATRVQSSDPLKAIQLTKNLIPILISAGLLPSAHPLLALSRLYTTLLITNLRSPFDSNTIELISPQIQQEHQVSAETEASLNDAQESLDEAIRSATRTCNGLNQILPFGHPVRAIAVTELGKLLSVDEPVPKHVVEPGSTSTSTVFSSSSNLQLAGAAPYPPSGPQRLKLAYETLVRARGELMVGFGGGKNEGGQVGEEVRKMLISVEKELGTWKEGIKSAIADMPQIALKK